MDGSALNVQCFHTVMVPANLCLHQPPNQYPLEWNLSESKATVLLFRLQSLLPKRQYALGPPCREQQH
jgi:hypothetical protein